MNRFMIPDKQLVGSAMAIRLTDGVFRNSILENNESFELMRDEQRQATILSCENKPRDLPVYGLAWIKL